MPRGLVSLAELRRTGAGLALAAALANAAVASRLLLALLPAVLWAGLMAREFFGSGVARARPAAYLLSHMVVMPLLFAYLTGLDWLVAGADPQRALPLFRPRLPERHPRGDWPEDPRAGCRESGRGDLHGDVGHPRGAGRLARRARAGGHPRRDGGAADGCGGYAAAGLLILVPMAAFPALAFLRRPTSVHAKRIEAASGVWTLASYLLIGFAPLLARG